MNKPTKDNSFFRAGQVEEYQIGLEYEEIECPTCCGSGEEDDFFEGNEYTDVCCDCHGSGVFYVRIDPQE